MTQPDLLAPINNIGEDVRVNLVHGWRMRGYQLRAANKMFSGELRTDPATGAKVGPERDGTAVHIDPGMGKTIIGLTAIVEWFKWGICKKPVLIVAPIKVCETVWRQEARDWSHTRHLQFQLVRGSEKDRAFALARPCHAFLVNPEMLVWLQKYIRADWGAHFDALIIDESSMFKDSRSKRFKVLTNYGTRVTLKGPDGKSLKDPLTGENILVPAHRFKRSAVLTGTPSPSGLQNLWSPIYILDHGQRLHKHFDTFQGRFFHKERQLAPHVHKHSLNPEEDETRPMWQARQSAPERIHELIADITVELNAEDHGVLPRQLPPFKQYIDLPDEVLPHYRKLERDAVLEMLADPILAANGGAKSMMCWQMCNGAIYSTDAYGKKIWQNIHDRKLDKLVELIDGLDKHCVIPYQFQHDLARIAERFKKEGIPYAVLNGKNTQSTIDRWNAGGIPNLLLHPQSAGHGLNLQFGGHTFIWFGPIWSLERWLQTIARLARSGQKEIVGVHVIMARNTTDEVRFNQLGTLGDDQTRFRKALIEYQRQMGIGLDTTPELTETVAHDPFKGITL
jgi:SNF2 family DNA or RNA helicase